MLKHQKKFFNKISDTYHQNSSRYQESYKSLRKETVGQIKGNVLDIGNGGTIGYSIKNAKTLTLADISEVILKNPRISIGKKFKPLVHKKLKCVVADVMSLPFRKNQFDTVIIISTIHHLSEKSLNISKINIIKAF